MSISKLTIPYPAVQNYEVMDDFIFNDNNQAIVAKINETIDVVNGFEVESRGYEIVSTTIGTGWSDTAPYTQKVNVAGVIQDGVVFLSLNPSTTLSIAKQQLEAWSSINEVKLENGKLEFICFYDKPILSIPINVGILV